MRLRLDDTTQDAMLLAFLLAARIAVESATRRTLITTEYQMFYEQFRAYWDGIDLLSYYLPFMELRKPPIQRVESITYVDIDGATQTLDSSLYQVDTSYIMGRIVPASGAVWPAVTVQPQCVTITYLAGYGNTAASVPQPLVEAIYSLACDIYEHPEFNVESRLEESRAAKWLLNSYKLIGCE
jgi:uncharacterized phiE125 gp8 family phage protein